MGWSQHDKDLSAKLFQDGLSYSQIGMQLKDRHTRSAIGASLVRRGLMRGGSGTVNPTPRARAAPRPRRTRIETQNLAPTDQRFKFAAIEAAPIVMPPPEQRRSLLQLTDKTCRWPLGDPVAPDFCFCGGRPLSTDPYCAYHARMAYQPAHARRQQIPRPR